MMLPRQLRRSVTAPRTSHLFLPQTLSSLLHRSLSTYSVDNLSPTKSEPVLGKLDRFHVQPQRERFRVALVGRTNVGKSTLYNRLTKSRKAIVHNVPGTTRDRRYAPAQLAGLEFDVIDTGGLEDAPSGTLEEGMLEQTRLAVHEADLVFFLIDGRQSVTPIDSHFARWLRRENPHAPIHLVANKLEGDADRWQSELNDCYQLGFDQAIPLSAEHGEGITGLLDVIIPLYDAHEAEQDEIQALIAAEIAEQNEAKGEESVEEDDDKRTIKLAIVGRPNVGKSTLLNRIVRSERVLTGPEPGVTRDSVEVPWQYQGRTIKLVDTAGIRRYSKRDLENPIENLSVRDAFRAIDSAHVVAVVVDLSEPKLIHMDLTIAHRVLDEGRALVLVANKSDVPRVLEQEVRRLQNELETSLAQVKGVPVVPISALHGNGIRKLLPAVVAAYQRWDTRVSTGRLNRWLHAMERHHPPPSIKGKPLNVKYMTQVKSRPPTFAMFVNKPKEVPASYQRFMLTQLRDEFDMIGVPARLLLRGSTNENPFTKRKRFQKRTSRVSYGKPRSKNNQNEESEKVSRPVNTKEGIHTSRKDKPINRK